MHEEERAPEGERRAGRRSFRRACRPRINHSTSCRAPRSGPSGLLAPVLRHPAFLLPALPLLPLACFPLARTVKMNSLPTRPSDAVSQAAFESRARATASRPPTTKRRSVRCRALPLERHPAKFITPLSVSGVRPPSTLAGRSSSSHPQVRSCRLSSRESPSPTSFSGLTQARCGRNNSSVWASAPQSTRLPPWTLASVPANTSSSKKPRRCVWPMNLWRARRPTRRRRCFRNISKMPATTTRLNGTP